MIHLSYNGELYSYDNKTTTTVSEVTNIPVVIHPYVDIEGAKLYYKQDDVDGIVNISDNTANIPGAYLVTGDLQVALKLASGEMSNSFTIGVTVISSSGDIMDDDIRFTMDNKKRLILVPGYQTLLAIQFDNQSEIVTFKLPRYQEGVDLSTKVPYVNYRRPQVKDLGKALCTIEKTTEDSIYITWMVDATATQYDGVIQFQVEFADSEGYRWQSQIGEIPILASLYNTGLEPYTPDILEQYLGIMQEYSQQAAASAQEAQEIADSMAGRGLTEDFKQALLQVVAHIGAWSDAHGQDYYDDLYDALYPPVNLDSISALFQPGTAVINDTMSLDDLKQYLTVTAVYTDSSTEELSSSDYSLSGSMTAGNQTITVSYGGKTTTFTVTVVEWLVSISAVFTQGSATIYDTDSLDTLKQYLTVTVNYADSTTETVTDYTLSGTLTAGTSTVTVSYGGKTTTFDAVVTETLPSGYTHLDYVTANGTQYIQTNLTESDLRYCGYEVKASSTGTTNGNGHLLSSANMFFTRLSYQSGRWYSTKRFGNESGTSAGGSIDQWVVGTVYVLEAFKNGSDLVSINGIPYRYFTPGSDYTASNKFAIFAYGGSVSTTKYRFHGNFYYMKLENTDGELIHYFVPCKNASNVVGLYDVIDGVFYPPTAGTLVGA